MFWKLRIPFQVLTRKKMRQMEISFRLTWWRICGRWEQRTLIFYISWPDVYRWMSITIKSDGINPRRSGPSVVQQWWNISTNIKRCSDRMPFVWSTIPRKRRRGLWRSRHFDWRPSSVQATEKAQSQRMALQRWISNPPTLLKKFRFHFTTPTSWAVGYLKTDANVLQSATLNDWTCRPMPTWYVCIDLLLLRMHTWLIRNIV